MTQAPPLFLHLATDEQLATEIARNDRAPSTAKGTTTMHALSVLLSLATITLALGAIIFSIDEAR